MQGQAHLFIEGDLFNVGQHLAGEIGLARTNGSGTSQGEIIVEGLAKGSPCVKLALQAPDQATPDSRCQGVSFVPAPIPCRIHIWPSYIDQPACLRDGAQ